MPPVMQNGTRWAAAVLILAAACAPFPADAASRLCRQIEAALARTTGGGSGGSGAARAYDRAVAAQAEAIAKTRARLGSGSCAPSFFGSGGCARLRASLGKMQDNLSALRRARAGMGNGPGERRRLLASLDANGCRGGDAPVPVRAGTPAGPQAAAKPERRRRPPRGQPFCVRTCDGYFFPMTRTTAPVEDQAVCEAACPGTAIEVFYRASRARADDMVSGRSRLPYSDLETAHLFRDARSPRPAGCACNAAKGFSQGLSVLPEPVPGAGTGPAAADAEIGMRPSDAAGERKVRVVGPTFLPAPEAAKGRPVPAPTPAP